MAQSNINYQALERFQRFADNLVETKFQLGEFKDNKTTIEITIDDLYAIAHTSDFVESQINRLSKVGRPKEKVRSKNALKQEAYRERKKKTLESK